MPRNLSFENIYAFQLSSRESFFSKSLGRFFKQKIDALLTLFIDKKISKKCEKLLQSTSTLEKCKKMEYSVFLRFIQRLDS